MKSLLQDLVQQYVAKNPKLMLRRYVEHNQSQSPRLLTDQNRSEFVLSSYESVWEFLSKSGDLIWYQGP